MKTLFKIFFYYPGRTVLWIQYMFPKKGNYFKSHRQYRHGGSFLAFLTSCSIWGVLIFLFIAISGKRQKTDSDQVATANTVESPPKSLVIENKTAAGNTSDGVYSRAVIVDELAPKNNVQQPSSQSAGYTDSDREIVIERFTTSITQNDTRNSRGTMLTDPIEILRQDRANAHKFGNPDGDDVDRFFSTPKHRTNMRTYLNRGSFPKPVQESVLEGRGFLRIKVYKNTQGEVSVDVAMRIRDQEEFYRERPY